MAVVAVGFLSACTAKVGGLPVATTTVPDELTSEVVFDDLTTVAPCSLTDPGAFDEYGTAEFTAPESLDYCAVRVNDISKDADVILSIGAFSVLSAQPELADNHVKDVEGGLWVGQQDDTPTFCSQLLVFPDGVTMQVSASVYDGSTDTCPMVETGMDHAIDVITDRDVEHREPERNSLLRIDPCELVDDDDIAAIPGLEGVSRPDEYPGRHTCFWERSPGSPVTVRVQFGAGPRPGVYSQGGTEGLVGGRPSATNRYPKVGENSYCAVETAHIRFDEIAGEDAYEVASVYSRAAGGQIDAACAAATAVAELVWPELPQA
ncbi:hypothetical protein [Actinophytocola glycyrrhizae]|uniref:DUF3558 domain-containing protein n=1 Tax=Actinophytocola glycyrrhizae TaxID=2044873 RepID=A0ABV9S4T6_9PSEU